MSKSNKLENDFVSAVFAGVALPLYTDVYLSLHTANVGEDGNQTTNEASFGGYQRVTLSIPADFTVNESTATNKNTIAFPESTTGGETVTHWAIGTAQSGLGDVLYYGQMSRDIEIIVALIVAVEANNLIINED